MNTIYWLAVLGQVVGYGVFIMSILGAIVMKKYTGTVLERLYIAENGITSLLRWRYFLAGLISTTVMVTI